MQHPRFPEGPSASCRPDRSLLLFVLGGLALVGGTAGWAQQDRPPAGFEIEHLSWIGTAQPGDTIEVSNAFGDLRARFGGYEGKVEIFATAQQFADEGAPLEIAGRQLPDGGVEVTVGSRGPDGALVTEPIAGRRQRVDLVVFVPQGASLRASTRDGLLQAKGLRSDLHATTSGGKLYAREIDGDVEMSSDSGDVLAVLKYRGTARRQVLSSKTGDVTLYASEESHLAVELETAGLISTDFSMDITRRETSPDGVRPTQHGAAQLGKGSTPVSLRSESGHLRLVRLPLAQEARP